MTRERKERTDKLFAAENAAWNAVLAAMPPFSDKGRTDGSYRFTPAYGAWEAAQEAIDAEFPRH